MTDGPGRDMCLGAITVQRQKMMLIFYPGQLTSKDNNDGGVVAKNG